MDSKSLKSVTGIFASSQGGDVLNMITRQVEKMSSTTIRTSIIFHSYFYYGNNSGQIFKYYIGKNYSLKSIKSVYAHNDFVRKIKIYAHDGEYFLLSSGDDGLLNILDLDLNVVGSISFKYNIVDFVLLNFSEHKNEFLYGINFCMKNVMHKNYACNLNLNKFYANLICISNVGMIPLFQYKKTKKLEDEYNKEPFLAVDTVFCAEEIKTRGGDTVILVGGSFLHVYLYSKNRGKLSLLKENKETGEIFSIKAFDEDNIYACGDGIYKIDKNNYTLSRVQLSTHNFCNMALFNVKYWALDFLRAVEILHDRVKYSTFLLGAGDGGSIAYLKIKEYEVFAENGRIFNFLVNRTENSGEKIQKKFLQEIMQSNINIAEENILYKISNKSENIFNLSNPLLKTKKIIEVTDQFICAEDKKYFSFLGRKIDSQKNTSDFSNFDLEMPSPVKSHYRIGDLLIMQCDHLYIFDFKTEEIIFKSEEPVLRIFYEDGLFVILLSESVTMLKLANLKTGLSNSTVENSIMHNAYYQLGEHSLFVYRIVHNFLNIISLHKNEITYLNYAGDIMREDITMHKKTLLFFMQSDKIMHCINIEYLKEIGKIMHERKIIFRILHCINNKTDQFNFLIACNMIKEAELIESVDVNSLSIMTNEEIDERIKNNRDGNFAVLKYHYIRNKDYANGLRCYDILKIDSSERDLLKILLN